MKLRKCKPYFKYDNIEYYSIEIDDESALNLGKDKPLTDEESKLQDLLILGHSDKLSDSSELQNIQTLGFKKKEISSDKVVQLDNIFCERKHGNPLFYACVSIYRDILMDLQSSASAAVKVKLLGLT